MEKPPCVERCTNTKQNRRARACMCVFLHARACMCVCMRSCDPRTYVSCFAGSIGHGLCLIRAWQVREAPGVRTVASHSLHFIQRQRQEKRTEVKKTKCVSHETVLIVHTHTTKKCMITPPTMPCKPHQLSAKETELWTSFRSITRRSEWRSALSDLTPISTFLCRGLVPECICLH